jgi:SNF2 family DNA or RNA helicase
LSRKRSIIEIESSSSSDSSDTEFENGDDDEEDDNDDGDNDDGDNDDMDVDGADDDEEDDDLLDDMIVGGGAKSKAAKRRKIKKVIDDASLDASTKDVSSLSVISNPSEASRTIQCLQPHKKRKGQITRMMRQMISSLAPFEGLSLFLWLIGQAEKAERARLAKLRQREQGLSQAQILAATSPAKKRKLAPSDDRQGIVLNPLRGADEPALFVDADISDVLKPHQIEGVRFLYDNVVVGKLGCILAHFSQFLCHEGSICVVALTSHCGDGNSLCSGNRHASLSR